jgi:hypothetical protein
VNDPVYRHATSAVNFQPVTGSRGLLTPASRRCREYVPAMLSFPCLCGISQIRRQLVFAGRHQQAIRTHEVVFLAKEDLRKKESKKPAK